MSKIIRTRKPSVLPFYAGALVFVVLCAVLPVYKLWALLAALAVLPWRLPWGRNSARPMWWNTRCRSTPGRTMWTPC